MKTNQKLILASSSPRRKALLRDAGISFICHPAEIVETILADESVEQHVMRLAKEKAESVAQLYPDSIILGADTVVFFDQKIFGKPKDLPAASEMLLSLSGNTHQVLTGLSLARYKKQSTCWYSVTEVTFNKLSDETIKAYFELVNPLDKAGAYAIQEHGKMLVKSINGLFSNVIGLPIEELQLKLKEIQN